MATLESRITVLETLDSDSRSVYSYSDRELVAILKPVLDGVEPTTEMLIALVERAKAKERVEP